MHVLSVSLSLGLSVSRPAALRDMAVWVGQQRPVETVEKKLSIESRFLVFFLSSLSPSFFS